MATIKSFTSLEQSRKLAEILPLESADMHYWRSTWREGDYATGVGHSKELQEGFTSKEIEYIPCWSLASLLCIIRRIIGYTIYGVSNVYMSCDLGDKPWKLETEVYDNEVDACVAMIEKLHELKML